MHILICTLFLSVTFNASPLFLDNPSLFFIISFFIMILLLLHVMHISSSLLSYLWCIPSKIQKFGTPQTIAIIVLKIEKFDVTSH